MLFNDFVSFRLGGPRFQATRPEDGHRLRHKAGGGVELENFLPMSCGIAGLLQQFPLGSGQGLFSFIDASCRKLPQVALGGMPVLALEQNERVPTFLHRGEYHHRSGMPDDFAKYAHPGWFQYSFRGDPEHWTTVDQAGSKNAG